MLPHPPPKVKKEEERSNLLVPNNFKDNKQKMKVKHGKFFISIGYAVGSAVNAVKPL